MGRRKKYITEEDKKKAASERSLKYYYANRDMITEKAKKKYWDDAWNAAISEQENETQSKNDA